MNREEILSHVDHTLLKPEATWPQIQTLCDEAIANHTASVCINTCDVKQAVDLVDLHKMTEGHLDATIMVAYLKQLERTDASAKH